MEEQYHGLSDEQVEKSRAQHGENVLTEPERRPWWKLLAEKFEDPIVIILLVALAASFGVACYHFWGMNDEARVFLEPVGIMVAIILATGVGFYFEQSANRKFELLNKVGDEDAVKVMRHGQVMEIPKREVVVDDIVLLGSGDEVCADGVLLEATSLQVNESSLTGEPMARKTVDEAQFDTEATYPSNRVYRGTTAVDGHGVMRVTAVGDGTEYGKVYEGARIDSSVVTPLQQQLNRLAALITKVSYLLATLIVVGRVMVYFNGAVGAIDWMDFGGFMLNTIMIAVTVIVVAVPEGLPMSVTLSLALSMRKMLATNNLVRKMHACETMGATTVICTDKTGTLTQNKMQVSEVLFEALPEPLIQEAVALNSTAHLSEEEGTLKVVGNPTEGALLLWLHGKGTDYKALRSSCDVTEQLVFSTERKYMATVVRSAAVGKRILFVKGAPEVVLGMVGRYIGIARETYQQQLLHWQQQAMRSLALAYVELPGEEEAIREGRVQVGGLTMLGVVGITDPVRADVPSAITDCMSAGIKVKIVTGDTAATAKEIGRQVGLWSDTDSDDCCITGVEFEALTDEQLLQRVGNLKIIARARPMDKKRLVETLQQLGEVVAVTGDGTNDAPALNAAQVGLSMGDGTKVAKEASAITIMDNSFGSIVQAVLWGRSLYQNIQRFIVFQMTINVAACLTVLIGAFMGTESPLTVTQMLWVNLIMDTFAALALASLPPDEKVMQVPPRNNKQHIIVPKMARLIVGTGLLFTALLLCFVKYFNVYSITAVTDLAVGDFFSSLLSSGGEGLSVYERTVIFTLFVALQFWNMFNVRALFTGRSAFSGLGKILKGFGSVALLIVGGQLLIVTFGGEMFGVQPLSASDWVWLFVGTSVVLWVGELARIVQRLMSSRR